jgi:small subunit ribosomal protein S27e
MEYDLLFPNPKTERRKHKLKTLIQQPKSFFIDLKDPVSGEVVHTFSHANCVIKTK